VLVLILIGVVCAGCMAMSNNRSATLGGGGGGSYGTGYQGYSPSCSTTGPVGSTGGGFWTGMATGGLAGYLFGRNRNHSGGAGRTYYGNDNYAPGRVGSWGSTPSGEVGSRRVTATGYGTTSNR